MKQLVRITLTLIIAFWSFGVFAQITDTNMMQTNDLRSMMKQWREQMRAQIQAQDQELKQLVDQMNGAPATLKMDAVVAVVNKLVQDRLAMHQMMEQHREMMQQMCDQFCPSNGPMHRHQWRGGRDTNGMMTPPPVPGAQQ